MAWHAYNVSYRKGSCVYAEIVHAQSEFEAMKLVEAKNPGSTAQTCKQVG